MPHPLTIPRDQDNASLTVDGKEVRLTKLSDLWKLVNGADGGNLLASAGCRTG